MNDALWYSLVVKMKYFFAKDKIFKQSGTPFTSAQTVLAITHNVTKIIS